MMPVAINLTIWVCVESNCVSDVLDDDLQAFADPGTALAFCLNFQYALLHADWPEELLSSQFDAVHEVHVENEEGKHLVWRGLRVRMGVHCGAPIMIRLRYS